MYTKVKVVGRRIRLLLSLCVKTWEDTVTVAVILLFYIIIILFIPKEPSHTFLEQQWTEKCKTFFYVGRPKYQIQIVVFDGHQSSTNTPIYIFVVESFSGSPLV